MRPPWLLMAILVGSRACQRWQLHRLNNGFACLSTNDSRRDGDELAV
jgi:hypothetical protein